MSDERKLNVFSVFEKTADTYESAAQRIKAEKGNKVNRFRMSEDGTYKLRVLPLAPEIDEDGNPIPMERTGYEYPFKQIFLEIELPAKKGKKGKKMNIPVVRATEKHVGKSIDLIDTYVRIAKDIHGDDEALMNLIKKGGYEHGLKWSSQRAMYIIDCAHREKGIQLFTPSYSQYRDMDDAKIDLWDELLEEDDRRGCPISGVTGAWPVTFKRSDNNGKTEYKISINARKATDEWDLTEDELMNLLDTERIPSVIFRYTRYHAEATVVFLKQYDERHGMKVTETDEWKEAVDTLMGELSPEDVQHFDLATAGTSKSDNEGGVGLTLDELYSKLDYIADNDLPNSSDEYQELRGLIKQFVEENKLDIRLSHNLSNEELLDMIDEEIKNQPSVPNGTKVDKTDNKNEEGKGDVDDDQEEQRPSSRRTRKKDPEPEDDDNNGDDDDQKPEPEPERRERHRPKRPSDDDDDDDNASSPKSDDDDDDEAPRRERRRERRAR